MIIYESDLEGYAFEETKMILAKYINKAIFVHRLF